MGQWLNAWVIGYISPNKIPQTTIVAFGAIIDTQDVSIYIHIIDKNTFEINDRNFWHCFLLGAGRSSEVERSLMVRWVVGSILHVVDTLSYLSFQPVLHDWCNKGRGMCYPVCGMVHIKEPLLLIDKSSLCGGSGFPFSLSEWSLTICLTPYNRRKMCWVRR